MTDDHNDVDHDDLLDVLKDVLFYAPIGLILDAQAVTPDLAARGRQHAKNARHIGELAVKQGLKRVDALLGQQTDDTTVEEGAAKTPAERQSGPSDEADDGEPEVSGDHLAIPEYDLLAASQVVKRLDALTTPELEAVRRYEAATRDRRTILHKIARLQGT